MTGWLLDTNVLSELRKGRCEPAVRAFVSSKPLDAVFISVVTVAEIRYGAEILNDAARRAELQSWLDQDVRRAFHGRVLRLGEDVLLRWRLIVREGRKINHTFQMPDALIAATAAHYGLIVVTRDVSQFQKAGTPVFNPWPAHDA